MILKDYTLLGPFCVFVSIRCMYFSTRSIFISSLVGYIVPPVENWLLALTPENFWKLMFFPVCWAVPTGVLRQGVLSIKIDFTKGQVSLCYTSLLGHIFWVTVKVLTVSSLFEFVNVIASLWFSHSVLLHQ